MPIAPIGQTNLAGVGVPNVLVQIVPPNPLLNGVPTNIIGVVGTASWGPINAPTVIGSLQQLLNTFGSPANAQYDLGTPIYAALQQSANNFLGVRVTDGTDVASTGDVLDTSTAIGVILTAIYTGTVGNNLLAQITFGSNYTVANPSFRLSVWLAGGVPEVFDNIGGTGAVFWSNLVNVVNNGQGVTRGPSQLVKAQLPGIISSVTVSAAGSYQTIPTLSATIGTGATLVPHMKVVSASIPSGGAGTGWAMNDTATVIGGTGTAAVITVNTVDGSGGILTFTVSTPGNYTVLPSNPVSVTPSAAGTGASFNLAWGLLSVTVSAGGTGFTSSSALVVSGGNGTGATGTLVLSTAASSTAPALNSVPYTFSGGLNGNGGVTDTTLIGNDTVTTINGVTYSRTGMYALRSTNASIGILADQTVFASNWNTQATFGLSEGMYMITSFANGFENNIGSPTSSGTMIYDKIQNVTPSYALKIMCGDWVQIFDPFNNVTRLINPQGFVAGILAAQLPDNSSLNKPMNGIISTQKLLLQQVYSNADLLAMETAGIDVITKPIPASISDFGCRLGVNASGAATTIGDNYTRMVNFLAETFNTGLGGFVGLPQTVDVQLQARNTIQNFLANIQFLGMIGTIDGSPAYRVTLDSTNNPPQRVALGYMQADVQVTLWSIIFVFVVNLQAGQSVQISVLPPQPL